MAARASLRGGHRQQARSALPMSAMLLSWRFGATGAATAAAGNSVTASRPAPNQQQRRIATPQIQVGRNYFSIVAFLT
jgi:hypothetical protein